MEKKIIYKYANLNLLFELFKFIGLEVYFFFFLFKNYKIHLIC